MSESMPMVTRLRYWLGAFLAIGIVLFFYAGAPLGAILGGGFLTLFYILLRYRK